MLQLKLFISFLEIQKRISNISLLGQEMESRTTGGLLGLHIFPGIDSTSAFVRKGKKKAFVLFKQYVGYSSKEYFKVSSKYGTFCVQTLQAFSQ